jgi:hypothetical protein
MSLRNVPFLDVGYLQNCTTEFRFLRLGAHSGSGGKIPEPDRSGRARLVSL